MVSIANKNKKGLYVLTAQTDKYPPLIGVDNDAVHVYGYSGRPIRDVTQPAGYRPPQNANSDRESQRSEKSPLDAYRRRSRNAIDPNFTLD